MNKGNWGKVRAFFDIMTDEGFTIKGFKIIEGINGLFVGVPSQKGKDDEYFDTVFVAPELREELNHVALQAYGMEESPAADNFSFPEKAASGSSDSITSQESNTENLDMSPSVASDENKTEEPVKYSDDDDINNVLETILGPGDNFHVYRGLRHQMIALEDTELFEFSTQHFDSDSYRITKGD